LIQPFILACAVGSKSVLSRAVAGLQLLVANNAVASVSGIACRVACVDWTLAAHQANASELLDLFASLEGCEVATEIHLLQAVVSMTSTMNLTGQPMAKALGLSINKLSHKTDRVRSTAIATTVSANGDALLQWKTEPVCVAHSGKSSSACSIAPCSSAIRRRRQRRRRRRSARSWSTTPSRRCAISATSQRATMRCSCLVRMRRFCSPLLTPAAVAHLSPEVALLLVGLRLVLVLETTSHASCVRVRAIRLKP
jgi:hypothetical protein